MKIRRLLVSVLFSFGLCLPALAGGPVRYSPPELAGVSLELPAAATGSLVVEKTLYVSMGTAGVAIYDLVGGQPVLRGVRTFDGAAQGVTLVGGRPWVLLETRSARPLEEGGSAVAPGEGVTTGPATAPQASSSPRTAAVGGQVLGLGNGSVVVDAGLDKGLKVGDELRFFSRVADDLGVIGSSGTAYREQEAGTGEVVSLGPDRARILLARGSRVMAGDRFERRVASRGRNFAPARLGGMKEFSATIRPFLAVGNLGVGSVNEVGISWFAEQPWFVEARLQPFTAGWSREGNLLSLAAMVSGGYEQRFYAVGLGLGLAAANTGVTSISTGYADAAAEGGSLRFDAVKLGLSLGQVVRLGARDGLHLEIRNAFVLGTVEEYTGGEYVYDEETGSYTYSDPVLVGEHKEFRWGATQGRLIVPVNRTTDLFTAAGGGAAGYFSIEGGVKTWLKGNGDRGSLGVSASAGFGMQEGTIREEGKDGQYTSTRVDILGPLVAVGVVQRW